MDTRTQLLDAAERLFAERGYSGTSIRAITNEAGANLAAVGYYFGSKADLAAAVARRVIEPINAAQGENLDRLLAAGGEPAVADLVEAFVGPLFDVRSARTSRLLMTILGDPAEEMRSWVGPVEAMFRDRYLAALQRALPGLAEQELWFRVRGMLAVTVVDRIEPTGDEGRRWAVTFLAAAMSAPPTR
ncbi:TetR family transcriptional regulator [Dactylosporangium vinaceum]|uniref:TetR/AcrR family transcriptional regulator n=1 Tax=Dactylosporangium vinaceum TaxID=53362 RepID=A0ABV5MLL3_9ACTN|nr:TetR family transcriptional regulator [Dactylosporangium vinaceum]UAB96939.1 TetR family transcriptional regulator [Dactylosporangium vinaceum]